MQLFSLMFFLLTCGIAGIILSPPFEERGALTAKQKDKITMPRFKYFIARTSHAANQDTFITYYKDDYLNTEAPHTSYTLLIGGFEFILDVIPMSAKGSTAC